MLKVGDMVVYTTTGLCEVADIETKKIGKILKDYYVLKPSVSTTATVFIPTDNEKLLEKVHEVLSKNDILSLIDEVKSSEPQWIEDDNARKNHFREIISLGNRKDCLMVLRTIKCHQQELSGSGKRLHIADEMIMKDVIKIVCSEIAFVLKISLEEAAETII